MSRQIIADAIAGELERLEDLPIGEHAPVYESVYAMLSDSLDAPAHAGE
ncbi:hypothetical protein GCM10010401_22850 [Rarobacter faecitabidus]|uniref:Uncharacterized protein n=1 Tax=Rarobacter faecitabidus TaxID=13243 RepID=A0A542ZW31_RARFA|nr:hypothetical protein [Rarobacter faecitabidus]TQL64573.1 hypothetical protein FB461_1079 [Rarobacter faecitabidus]